MYTGIIGIRSKGYIATMISSKGLRPNNYLIGNYTKQLPSKHVADSVVPCLMQLWLVYTYRWMDHAYIYSMQDNDPKGSVKHYYSYTIVSIP